MVAQVKSLLAPTMEPVEDVVDEFFYGHRMVRTVDAEGKTCIIYQPLKREDFLNPEEGDHFMQGTQHDKDVDEIKGIFQHLYRDDPDTTVYSDLQMLWGIEDSDKPAPDVSVIPNVIDPKKPRGSFDVVKEGTKPRFVLEMVSPNHVQADYKDKPAIYAQAGIEEYIIIDSGLRPRKETLNYSVKGYRMQGDRYIDLVPDDQGWIYSEVNHVWIGPNDAKDGFIVIDARTNERILASRERAEVEEAARIQAELLAGKEETARHQAEQRVEEEAAARLQVEQQLQEMAAEMARLKELIAQNPTQDSD